LRFQEGYAALFIPANPQLSAIPHTRQQSPLRIAGGGNLQVCAECGGPVYADARVVQHHLVPSIHVAVFPATIPPQRSDFTADLASASSQ
jgi:hypothetical protein